MREFVERADIGAMRTGIGLRTPHYREFFQRRPALGFVEVHSENFFGRNGRAIGGQPQQVLERVRADYALSLHGIGLSLGSAEPVRRDHLAQLKLLVDRFEPRWVSDHLAWVGLNGIYANDLLPLPYTEEALSIIVANIDKAQNFLGRGILIENPSSYLAFAHSTISEWDFINAIVARTGCGILLDVNNVYVSACNLGFDPQRYLAAIEADAVREIHLAGFSRNGEMVIDTHSREVDDAVWALYEFTLRQLGDRPTLIEWDTDLPDLSVLLEESAKSDRVRAKCLFAVGELEEERNRVLE